MNLTTTTDEVFADRWGVRLALPTILSSLHASPTRPMREATDTLRGGAR